jgi:hypothetical protein
LAPVDDALLDVGEDAAADAEPVPEDVGDEAAALLVPEAEGDVMDAEGEDAELEGARLETDVMVTPTARHAWRAVSLA